MTAIKINHLACCAFCLFFIISCAKEKPQLSTLITPLSARALYERALKNSDAFGKIKLIEWDSISNLAFIQNVEIPTPYRQTGYFLKDRTEILAFQIPLKKGEQIDIQINTDSADIQVFMDFFQKNNGCWKPIIKIKKGENTIHFKVKETETFLLRIQPEFYKKTGYELRIEKKPIYAFPVAGKGNSDVWSFWGDPRDGGKRKHKGIDIFAKRGTPLIAATSGYVANVSEKGLGGKQVWIRDLKNNSNLYYAHLSKQLVREGQTVEVGDTIGLVGNSGNARNTPSHLHFAVYIRRKGAVDPLPFVYKYKNKFPSNTAKIKSDILNKGITYGNANLRSKPNSKNSFLKKIKNGNLIELMGVSGKWYHIRTLDGEVGFIHYSSVQQLEGRMTGLLQDWTGGQSLPFSLKNIGGFYRISG